MTNLLIDLTDWALKSAAAITLAFGCALALRRHSAATKNLVWRTALIVVVLLPIAMAIPARMQAPSVMEPIQAPIRTALTPIATPPSFHPVRSTQVGSALPPSKSPLNWELLASCAYFVGVIVVIGGWTAGYFRIRRIASPSVEDRGLVSPHPVLRAADPDLRVPVTFGLFRPVILLPAEAETWPEERIRAALLHESAHIVRGDWAWQTAAVWVRALQWFNPAVWLLASSLNESSEAAADDEVVVGFGISAATYAGELLNVAESAQAWLGAATAMVRPRGVSSRVKRIVAKGVDRKRPGRMFVTGFALLFAAAGLAFSAGSIAEANQSKVPHGPVVAEVKLKQGGVLHLAYMTGNANGTGASWRPDGTAATKEDTSPFKNLVGFVGDDRSVAGMRVVSFSFLISDLHCKPEDSDSVLYRIKDLKNAEYNGGLGQYAGDRAVNRDIWKVPQSVSNVDFDCWVASKPFEVVVHGTVGDGQLDLKVGPREADTRYAPDPKNPGKMIVTHTYDKTQSEVSFVLPPSLDGKDVRLRTYDSAGKPIENGGGPTGPFTAGKTLQYSFGQTNPKDIVSYEIQARDFEHVTLTGIRLLPDARP